MQESERINLETGIGGSDLRKLERGGEHFEFSEPLRLTPCDRHSKENPQFGGQKFKLSGATSGPPL